MIQKQNRCGDIGLFQNLVDSELLMRQLIANGYTVAHDPEEARGEIAVINTCGFIGDAKEESINMILTFAEAKNGINSKSSM